jgi:hypothetical protein
MKLDLLSIFRNLAPCGLIVEYQAYKDWQRVLSVCMMWISYELVKYYKDDKIRLTKVDEW